MLMKSTNESWHDPCVMPECRNCDSSRFVELVDQAQQVDDDTRSSYNKSKSKTQSNPHDAELDCPELDEVVRVDASLDASEKHSMSSKDNDNKDEASKLIKPEQNRLLDVNTKLDLNHNQPAEGEASSAKPDAVRWNPRSITISGFADDF